MPGSRWELTAKANFRISTVRLTSEACAAKVHWGVNQCGEDKYWSCVGYSLVVPQKPYYDIVQNLEQGQEIQQYLAATDVLKCGEQTAKRLEESYGPKGMFYWPAEHSYRILLEHRSYSCNYRRTTQECSIRTRTHITHYCHYSKQPVIRFIGLQQTRSMITDSR